MNRRSVDTRNKLTEAQKRNIKADRLMGMSYSSIAKKYGVSATTVSYICKHDKGLTLAIDQKAQDNISDILAYMDSNKATVIEIIDLSLHELPERIRNAKSAVEITTALGTLLDKWALAQNMEQRRAAERKAEEGDDPLTQAIKQAIASGKL